MVNSFANHPELLNKGKTLAEVLGVAPAVAKMSVKGELDCNDMDALSVLYNADNNLTIEEYKAIRRENIDVHCLVRLKTEQGISYQKALTYLENVRNHQCIEKREAMNVWEDYLNMARRLHIDLTDKSRLYPNSLKKEHDVATFAYNSIKVNVDAEQFSLQADKNKYFEYSYKDLVAVVPKTPQDIVEEASRQKNCLRSYIDRVKNGNTVVVFIRRAIMPDATYVTAEVSNGRLVQLKGYCNSNPRNKELVEFVQHWSKAKGITVAC
jgi:hypothetical protein